MPTGHSRKVSGKVTVLLPSRRKWIETGTTRPLVGRWIFSNRIAHSVLQPRFSCIITLSQERRVFFFIRWKVDWQARYDPIVPSRWWSLSLSFAGMSCLSSTLTRRKSWKPSFKHSFNCWVRFLEDQWDPSWPRYCFFPATDRAGQRIAVEGPSVRDSV